MKIMMTMMLVMGLTWGLKAQDLNKKEVPQKLLSAFEENNSNATDVEWERDGANYKVEFEENQQDVDIWYGPSGEILKTHRELREDDLPKAVKETIQNSYPSFKFDEGELQAENGQDTYKVELEEGNVEKTVYLDSSGKTIREHTDQ